ncbi:hypothetical protein N0V90_005346 [Kalmusia sp. IMI 367209]|nr:hypothetical protein N0V90_005346 [Kalmusia sp. IMI 367209]
MKFFAIAASFVAAVAAQSYDTGAETCSIVSTVTETVTLPYGRALGPLGCPNSASLPHRRGSYPSAPAPSGTAPAVPSYPAVVPSVPAGTAPVGTGAPVPSASASYSAPPSYFTGAASNVQVGGFVAGVGAFAAMFL